MENQMEKFHNLPEIERMGVQTQTTCLLCNSQDESGAHLFFNYLYTRTILLATTETHNHSF